MSSNKKVEKTDQGDFRIPRKDGTTTVVTKEFVEELDRTHPVELYTELATHTVTCIISAKQDEILRDSDFSSLADKLTIYEIDGDHNFTGKDREGLLVLLKSLL